jgi:hypothetical protein
MRCEDNSENEMKLRCLLLSLLVAGTIQVQAQTDADGEAIRQAALDYIEGWYTGDGERMERAVHPQLAKRIVRTDPQSQQSTLGHQDAATLVGNTSAGGGTRTPEERRLKDVTILDVYENAASVKIVASDWVDYLHLARWNGEWKIINVLWELAPDGG